MPCNGAGARPVTRPKRSRGRRGAAPSRKRQTAVLRRVLRDAERAGGDDPDPRRPLRRPLARRRRRCASSARYARQLKGKLRCARRGVPPEHRPRPLARRARRQRAAPARPAARPAARAARAARPAAPARAEGGFRALIVLDEFQDVAKVKEMDALLRSHIQFQGEVASFVFAGSEPGMMRAARSRSSERPLYGQAVPMRLERASPTPTSPRTSPTASARAAASVGEALNPLIARAEGTRSARCCSRTGSGARSSPATAATLGDWNARATRPRSPSSSPSSTRTGGASRRASRRRCARSSPASGSPFQQRVLDQLDSARRAPPARRSGPSPRDADGRAERDGLRGSSTRSSRSGSSACASPARRPTPPSRARGDGDTGRPSNVSSGRPRSSRPPTASARTASPTRPRSTAARPAS